MHGIIQSRPVAFGLLGTQGTFNAYQAMRSRDELTMARINNRGVGGATSLIRHLQILRTVTEAVSRSLDLNEVIQKSLSALTHVTGHEIASLHLVSSDGKMLLLRGERGLSERLREVNEMLPIGQGLIGRVAASGRVRRVDEAGRAPDLLPAARAAVAADGIRGFLCVPIRARHRILGTLSLGRQTEERFTNEEIALLESTADQIGLALDNARLYSETRLQLERSHTDVVRAERLAAVGELAGGVAHEINNPLMIILGQVHLLLQSQDHDAVLTGLKVIDGATKRAANIVRELVLFAERSPLRRARCKVSDQIYKVLALHQSRLEGAHITVQTDSRTACGSRSPTTGRACRPTTWRASSIPSSPPRDRARAGAWGSPSPTAWWPSTRVVSGPRTDRAAARCS